MQVKKLQGTCELEHRVLLEIEKEALIQALIQSIARKGDPNEVKLILLMQQGLLNYIMIP